MKRECLDRSYFVERGTAGSRGSSTHVSKDVKSSRLHVFTSSREVIDELITTARRSA
jgi:hypothetical protein